jgi:hypothetical protein
MYSTLYRKWKMEETPPFVPKYLNPSFEDVDDNLKVIRTKHAHDWVGNLPTAFHMAVEYDMWKLHKLASSFESFLGASIRDWSKG